MGFTVKTGTAVDNGLAKGDVISTQPAAGIGAGATGAATIELIPSAGPRMICVPQVSGQTLAAAQAALGAPGSHRAVVTARCRARSRPGS